MDPYLVLVFGHLVGASALFAGWAVEFRALGTGAGGSSPLAPIGMLLTLATGLAMMAWRWGAEPWTLVAIAGLVLNLAVAAAAARLAAGARADRALTLRRRSVLVNAGIGLGLLAIMAAKPSLFASLLLLAAGLAAGIALVPALAGPPRSAARSDRER